MGMKLFGKKGCDFSESWPLLTSLQHPRYLPRNAETYCNCVKANENSMHYGDSKHLSPEFFQKTNFIHFYPLFSRYFNGFFGSSKLHPSSIVSVWARRGGSRGAGADMADSDESEYLEESESEEMSDEAWGGKKTPQFQRVNEAVVCHQISIWQPRKGSWK